MLRKVLLFVILIMALAACSSISSATPSAESLPVLVMDDAHFQDENLVYEIPAGNGFILDAQNYTFQVPAGAGPLVTNYVQLVDVAKDGQFYGMEWQTGKSSHAITVDKLQPLSGTSAFSGFKPDQTLVVAVGNMTDGSFIPLWTATIEVK